jgi:hypothetical protein
MKRQLENQHFRRGNTSFDVEGLSELGERLDRLQVNNPNNEKKITDIIRKALKEARKDLSDAAGDALKHDPRDAKKAVKMMVYKQILGGNLSILNRRKHGGMTSGYEPPRTLKPKQRGGNRVKRGARTQQMMDYYGPERAFILRWMNEGNYKTSPRRAGTRGGKLSGDRGDLKNIPRGWFKPAALKSMEMAVREIKKEIDRLFEEEFNK